MKTLGGKKQTNSWEEPIARRGETLGGGHKVCAEKKQGKNGFGRGYRGVFDEKGEQRAGPHGKRAIALSNRPKREKTPISARKV